MINNEIISFDSNKVKFETILRNNVITPVVKKYSSSLECENIYFASSIIHDKQFVMNDSLYTFRIPQVYSWNPNLNEITMEYCNGQNLEIMLRNNQTHNIGANILNNIFTYILNNNIGWVDFAPRNILIDKDYITFVDFEKGFMPCDMTLNQKLRNHLYEEYSSFLLPFERIIPSNMIFNPTEKEKSITIETKDIPVKRVKAIAYELGLYSQMTLADQCKIYTMILIAEEPFIQNNEIIYPRVELENILGDKKENNYKDYAKRVLDICAKKLDEETTNIQKRE